LNRKKIFGFLTAPELTTCTSVCKYWHTLAEEDYVWRFHVLMRWGIAAVGKNWKLIYKKRHLEEQRRAISYGPTSLEHALKRQRIYRPDPRPYVSTKEGKELAQALGN